MDVISMSAKKVFNFLVVLKAMRKMKKTVPFVLVSTKIL